MKMKHLLAGLLLAGTVAFTTGCKSKPKDADVKAKVDATLPAGVTSDVKEGVVTLNGQVADEAAKASAESGVKALGEKEGVASVVNNISVVAPPPPPMPEVTINPDQALTDGVKSALSAYPTVTADVKEGVITLTGTIKKAELQAVIAAAQALKPKKVENKLTIK